MLSEKVVLHLKKKKTHIIIARIAQNLKEHIIIYGNCTFNANYYDVYHGAYSFVSIAICVTQNVKNPFFFFSIYIKPPHAKTIIIIERVEYFLAYASLTLTQSHGVVFRIRLYRK